MDWRRASAICAKQTVELVEGVADIGGRLVAAVEGAGDLVDVAADPAERAQQLSAEDVRIPPFFRQRQVDEEPAVDEGEGDVGGESGLG